ncbi:FecCD family ABC transporter permease [Halapricum desulfuricans]|uniref:Cobalamin import system permease protein BtuC n=1 Tax=Halapricum desulfuricans TaxID=2841257 RepID=A0A897NB92_9EURY|nr:iron ABC transporter permease [Halapricum desulfuricans]QSG09661.1 ABC-type Fe3+-siderophore transport system, permease component [Halapricum desulfuricans]QSG11242.1 ABC-type Fe3+-siderophore transport system, permease component [Halapricum desulfuricans]
MAGSDESAQASEGTTRQAEGAAQRYLSRVDRRRQFLVGSGIALAIASLAAVALGPTTIAPGDVVRIVLAGPNVETVDATIVWNIRLPRVVGAIVIGVGLSLAGTVMQSVLNNPLGSPYTLGLSHAAMFGAAVAIVGLDGGTMAAESLGLGAFDPYVVTASAFLASMASAGIILALAKYRGASPETMILTGIAIGSLCTAATTAIQYFASQSDLASIVFWSFGDVGRMTWRTVGILTVVVVLGLGYTLRHSWTYNALDAGDETARSVGVNVDAARNRGMVLASLITALAVAFVGIVGFVGLVVPHLVRKVIGNDKAFLLPASASVGALLLVVSDTAARTALAPTVLPVGIVTSFVGAPFFIYLVVRGKEYWSQ